jgi:CHAT domain-containing protein/Tfp pilus assembly protein PilF
MSHTFVSRLCVFLIVLGVPHFLCAQENQAARTSVTSVTVQDEEAARAVIQQFYAAKDAEGAMSFWSAKSPYREERRKRIQRFYATNANIVAGNLNIRRIEAEGELVVLRISMEIETSDPKTGKPGPGAGTEERVFSMRKEDGAWKIWRLQNASDVLATRILDADSDSARVALIQGDPDLPPELLKLALFNLGGSIRAKGDLAKARTCFLWMKTVSERSGDKPGISSAVINIGILSDMQGDHRGALRYFKEAQGIAEAIGDQKQLSNVLADIGIANEEQGDYTEAMAAYKRSLSIAESMDDKLTIANGLANIGEVYRMQGNTTAALEYYQRSLDIDLREKHDPVEIAQTLNNIGAVYQDLGNGARALDYFQQGLTQLNASQDARASMGTLTNIGEVYQSQGAYEEALDYYRKGIAIAEQLGDKDTRAAVTLDIGTIQQLQRHFAEAMDSFQKSRALDEETGNKAGIVSALDHIGGLQADQEQYSEALSTHKEALARAESLGLQPSVAQICTKMAQEHYRRGEYADQLVFAQKATSIAKGNNNQAILWQSRTFEGLAHRGLHDPAKARETFEEAITIVEDLRNQVAGAEEAKQGSFAEMLAPYYDMVELLVAQGQPAEALAYAERAKGRVLLDVMARGRVNITKAMNASEREQELQLQAELVSLNRQLQTEMAGPKPDEPRKKELSARLENKRVAYREFQTTVYTAHPELRTQRGGMQPLTVGEAAGLLPGSQAGLLEFLVAEQNTYLFVITKKAGADDSPNIRVYSIPIRAKNLQEKTESFRKQLADRNLGYRKSAQELYTLLLRPARLQLSGKTDLLIVPDGPLWNLPFQTLDSGQGRAMIESSAIAYAPSLTVLREMRHVHPAPEYAGKPARLTLLAMGNPSLNTEAVRRASFVYRGEKLEPLPEAAAEVTALGQVYGRDASEIQIGADAGEDKFKADAGKFRVLHLATHGILNDTSPMYSHVLLSSGGADSKEDGLLEAWEIMQMDLKADLVVLSACETARGHISAGEGVIGLTWAFFVAGVPTTVVSQWKVESASTAKLMLAFHQNLKAGGSHSASTFAKARALQRAQIQLLRSQQYAHPFYWAGFVVVGDPQ